MRNALLEGVVESRHHVGGDPRRLQRLEPPADFVEVAEVLSLDEVHHDVVDGAFGIDLVNADDVRVLELGAELAFAAERLFTANNSPVRRWVARKTRANVPAPTP